ncbi:glycine/D-amino acid oxidase-like deaminating enzyme [Mesorhizobium loti]|uniref:Glycine/D-amino acid oxidase-like deaminating enzyme n=1 Tax=Rhizobium loti TaxID=381 RepID=A0A8E2W869_RHILI|nr:FAD-binding oxidoreductase [Mesorhizobium loti]PWJ88137.1 glycine/D-amino acid oxidase-like deaminating enzyme [Mesorhizobium loti]
MFERRTVAIIGGGVVGASCALMLAREGHQVTVFEKDRVGYGCSWGNGAQYNAGSSLPMAYPGVMRQAMRWLTDKNGPVRLAPRELPRTFPWLLRFLSTGRLENWRPAYDALHALNAQCAGLYKDMLGEVGWNRHFRPNGALHVYRVDSLGPLDHIVDSMRNEKGVRFQRISFDEVLELEPQLSRSYRRGIFFPDSGHVTSPLGLVQGLMDRAASLGATIQAAAVVAIDPEADRVKLRTHSGVHGFDSVVIAAGIASRDLGRSLGVTLSLASERGYHITMPGAESAISRPVTDAASAIVATPLGEGLRIVGIAEFEAPDAAPTKGQNRKLRVSAQAMLPDLAVGQVTEWMGVRPSTPDSLPIIDRHPRYASVFFATGHGHMGISGAPMTAALISDLLAARTPRLSCTPYRLR